MKTAVTLTGHERALYARQMRLPEVGEAGQLNIKNAKVLLIGAGGLGLELITAFHLFEYREALALIIVMLVLVSVVHSISAYMRRKLV